MENQGSRRSPLEFRGSQEALVDIILAQQWEEIWSDICQVQRVTFPPTLPYPCHCSNDQQSRNGCVVCGGVLSADWQHAVLGFPQTSVVKPSYDFAILIDASLPCALPPTFPLVEATGQAILRESGSELSLAKGNLIHERNNPLCIMLSCTIHLIYQLNLLLW